MKMILILQFVMFSTDAFSMASDTTIPGPQQRIRIDLADGSRINGFIKYTTDSTAFFSDTRNGYGYWIPVEQVEAISFQQRNNMIKGALIGTGVGLVLGFLLGINGDCKKNNEPLEDCTILEAIFQRKTIRGAIYQGLVFSGVGFIAGAFSGKVTVRFPIQKGRRGFHDIRYPSY
jgi:hypothetical protein